MESKKTSSTRITSEAEKYLIDNFETVGAGLSICVDIVQRMNSEIKPFDLPDAVKSLSQIRRYSLREIQDVFSASEWSYMADALNGTIITPEFRAMNAGLIASVEDSGHFDGLAKKWKVNVSDLCTKIKKLTGAQIDAVYYRIEQFWDNPTDLSEWSKW